MPKISIIIPVYNVERYLEKCLHSVLQQTFQDFEVILIDDGSQDASGDICNQFAQKDSRITVYHQENQGQSAARNYGLTKATGEFIGFVDSDDYLKETMYQTLFDLCQKYQADLAMCRLLDCYQNTDIDYHQETVKEFVLNREQAIEMVMKAEIMSVTPVNKLYRRSLFHDITFPLGMIAEDAYIMLELIHQAKKIAVTTAIEYYYIHREGSSTAKSFSPIDLSAIKAYEKNLDFIKKHYPKLESVGLMRCCWAHFYALDKLLLSDYDDLKLKRELIRWLRKHFKVILHDSTFKRNRKFAMCLLMVNAKLYQIILQFNQRKNQKRYE